MTLAEIRKKYIGKRVSDSYANQHSIPINLDADPERQYYAEVTIDDDRRITHISRMTGQRLVSDDATRVTYKSIRIRANAYDLIEDAIESLLDPDDEDDDKAGPKEYVRRTDEEELRFAVRELDALERAAHSVTFYVNTEPTRQRIKNLMQKIAEKEHRFFRIVNEYNPKLARYELVLKEITPNEQETI